MDMKKKINKYLLTSCSLFVIVTSIVFCLLQRYEAVLIILLSWSCLLALYLVGDERKSVERERTIQELRRHNEELQKTVNRDKRNINSMNNYIKDLELLIVDDAEKARKKGKKKNRKRKRKGKK